MSGGSDGGGVVRAPCPDYSDELHKQRRGDASAPLRLRPAVPADAAAIAEVDRATSTQPWSEATFAAELARDDRRYVVAVVDAPSGGSADVGPAEPGGGEVVGYGALALLAGDGHVLGLAVTPDRQGRGIGRQLLLALLAAADDAGMAGVTLEVRPSNDVARHLYRRCGFEEAGRRPRYYPDGEDALLLWWHHPTVAADGDAIDDVPTDRERA